MPRYAKRASLSKRLGADVVVVGVGVSANDDLAVRAGVACDDGILMDGYGRTAVPNVFAVGDVARQRDPVSGRHVRFETWSHAQAQALATAGFLCNPAEAKASTGALVLVGPGQSPVAVCG